MEGLGRRETAKAVGARAVAGAKRAVADRIVQLLRQRDPDVLGNLVEIGVLSRDFVEGPGDAPISRSTPIEVVERLLERSVEQRPSLLATMGLSAIQVLSSPGDGDADGVPARLAVVFTDLEGFTGFTLSKGDEAASKLLVDHHRQVGPVVRSRGGRIVKRLGDGLLLTFPEPEAAVLAALELRDLPAPLRLRAGVHVGDVVVTRDDLVGHVVNVAARVAEAAPGGEVLVTADVVVAVHESLPHVPFAEPVDQPLKGLTDPVVVLRVADRDT